MSDDFETMPVGTAKLLREAQEELQAIDAGTTRRTHGDLIHRIEELLGRSHAAGATR